MRKCKGWDCTTFWNLLTTLRWQGWDSVTPLDHTEVARLRDFFIWTVRPPWVLLGSFSSIDIYTTVRESWFCPMHCIYSFIYTASWLCLPYYIFYLQIEHRDSHVVVALLWAEFSYSFSQITMVRVLVIKTLLYCCNSFPCSIFFPNYVFCLCDNLCLLFHMFRSSCTYDFRFCDFHSKYCDCFVYLFLPLVAIQFWVVTLAIYKKFFQ